MGEMLALARELKLPGEVLERLKQIKLGPDLPIRALASPETAKAAWEAVAARIPKWREDRGMTHLAVTLAAACHTRQAYRERGVPEEVFFATMGCLSRFLRETREMMGEWIFDRGHWTWRQTGGLLYRLGTLEFEYRKAEENEPLIPGLKAGVWVLSVHIPSDARLQREELERSYDWAERFFTGANAPYGAPRTMVCESWLLAPALKELLPERSNIRLFAGDYALCTVREGDQEFYRWLFQCEPPLPPEDLPGRTSLQRAARARLAAGGKIGAAYGVLKRGSRLLFL